MCWYIPFLYEIVAHLIVIQCPECGLAPTVSSSKDPDNVVVVHVLAALSRHVCNEPQEHINPYLCPRVVLHFPFLPQSGHFFQVPLGKKDRARRLAYVSALIL
jgi:hypothetical protein